MRLTQLKQKKLRSSHFDFRNISSFPTTCTCWSLGLECYTCHSPVPQSYSSIRSIFPIYSLQPVHCLAPHSLHWQWQPYSSICGPESPSNPQWYSWHVQRGTSPCHSATTHRLVWRYSIWSECLWDNCHHIPSLRVH